MKPGSPRESRDLSVSGGSSISLASSLSSVSRETVDCEIVKLETGLYQVSFVLKAIERHYVEIYFNQELVNSGEIIIRFFFS
jgi:hypothetical protein